MSKQIIPISEATYHVTIIQLMIASKSFGWKAETLDNIGISSGFYDNNNSIDKDFVFNVIDTPQKAYENFLHFAELNNITKYTLNLDVKVIFRY